MLIQPPALGGNYVSGFFICCAMCSDSVMTVINNNGQSLKV